VSHYLRFVSLFSMLIAISMVVGAALSIVPLDPLANQLDPQFYFNSVYSHWCFLLFGILIIVCNMVCAKVSPNFLSFINTYINISFIVLIGLAIYASSNKILTPSILIIFILSITSIYALYFNNVRQVLLLRITAQNDQVKFLNIQIDNAKEIIFDSERQAMESEQNYQKLFNSTRDGYVINKGSGELISPNPAYANMLGYTVSELKNISWKDLTPESWLEWEVETHGAQLVEKGYTELYEKEYIRKDGSVFPVQVQAFLLNETTKLEDSLIAAFARDITDIKQAEESAEKGKAIFNAVFDAIPDLFFLLGSDSVILDYRAGKQSNLLVPPEEFMGRSMIDMLPKDVSDIFSRTVEKALVSNNLETCEYELKIDGGFKFFEARLNCLPDNHQLIAVIRDVTDRKNTEIKVFHQANFDSLTELPNRFLVLDRLAQMLLDATRNDTMVAVLFMDLDDFKKVNDTLGHETGDKLLIEAANRLTKIVRKGDTVARLGGDEFIVLLKGITNATDPQIIVDSILKSFRCPVLVDNRNLVLTASIGIAISLINGNSSSALLRNADAAMYHAKSQGRNTYSYYTDDMNKAVERRLIIEEHLAKALENNELTVLYQPQFSVKDGNITGAEALLRWHSSELGSVSPNEFIPIAEHTGIIVEFGEYVLKESVSQFERLAGICGCSIKLSVNLSPRQFRDSLLLESIRKVLSDAGIDACNIGLEITEGVLLSGHSDINDSLIQLNEMGISLAMDDFGTGFSSLSYLRSYPFDVIKIDRVFIRDITKKDSDRKLVKASIAMAHSLGLTVIAEGVETQEQLDILKEFNCDSVQGFLLGKPESIEKWDQIWGK